MTQQSGAAKRPFNKGDFFRWCRVIHGWLSAVAFLLLCFFSVTGILLNHPEWLEGKAPSPIEKTFMLDAGELKRIRAADEPEKELAIVAATKITLKGELTGGNQVGKELFIRLQGVRGLTDIRAHLITGALTVTIEPVRPVSILNELHRAERAGTAWRLLVDISAGLLIALSIIGYLIFLSLRFRLRTALILTTGSAVAVWAVFMFAVA